MVWVLMVLRYRVMGMLRMLEMVVCYTRHRVRTSSTTSATPTASTTTTNH
jgi:hypothetical protein